MNDLKYVIVVPKGFASLSGRAIIFNGIINHCDVVKGLPEGWRTISAGFMKFDHFSDDINTLQVWGKSESLGIESDPVLDKILIRQTLSGTTPNFYEY